MIINGIDDPVRSALAGITVLDASRMLPGAVAARCLLDQGARVIKIESAAGDPLRWTPPMVDGMGAAFRAFYGGADSVTLDLSRSEDSRKFGRLAATADVVIESFRPGTMAKWGLAPDALLQANPALVVCSLSSFGQTGADAGRVGHDLNFLGESGLLSMLPSIGVPGVQIADVSGGLVAASSIVAALFARTRTGNGAWLDRSLAHGLSPLLTLAWLEADAGGGGLSDGILAGKCAAYNVYTCSDGRKITVAALEPKFWRDLIERLGLPSIRSSGLATGEEGAIAMAAVAEVVSTRSRDEWLQLLADLPVAGVDKLSPSCSYRPASVRLEAPELGRDTSRVLEAIE